MIFKGLYDEKSSTFKFFIFLSLVFLSAVLHILFALVVVYFFVDGGPDLIKYQDLNSQVSINYIKFLQLFTAIGMFITPVVFYSYLTNFNLYWNKTNRQAIFLVVAIVLLVAPLVSFLLELNSLIKFPSWILQFDNNSEILIQAFLKMPTIFDLVFNLLVIAIIPAVGEELFFRGYVQQILKNKFGSIHITILITAIIFSVFHLDFQGLIPRVFLGILLGYFFFWTKSLWVPIVAHFINNALAVFLTYLYPSGNIELEKIGYSINNSEPINYNAVMFSVLAVSILMYLLYKSQNYTKSKI